jgi:Flp pilus assembly protein TadD
MTTEEPPEAPKGRIRAGRMLVRILWVLAMGATAASGSWVGFQWFVSYASLRQAMVAYEAGALPDAAARAAVSIDTGFAPAAAYSLRGRVLGKQGRTDAALACFAAGIEAHDDDAGLRYWHADQLLTAGRLDQALAEADAAERLGHQSWRLHALRGAVHYMREDQAAAAKALRRAVDLEPSEWWPYSLLARSLATVESPRAALVVCAVALEEFPDDPNLIHVRGIILLQSGRNGPALADFDRAVALDGNMATFHGSRGQALFALNRNDEALSAFERALELDPAQPGAQRGRDSARHAIATDR